LRPLRRTVLRGCDVFTLLPGGVIWPSAGTI